MKGSLRFYAVLLGVVGLFVLTAHPAAAATSAPAQGFNVLTSPLPIKLTTQPGSTVTTELRLKNQGTAPETIKVGLMKFGAQGDLGRPDLFDLTPKDTYASWVHFDPEQFVAEPNVWDTVKMTINVPQEASLGYYLAVTFSRASQPGQKDATNVKGAAATLVLLEVKTPNEQRNLKLVDFSATHSLYEYLPTTFNVRVRNTGNIYLAPTGNIFITRGSTPVSTIDFNDAGGSVLPNSNRQYTVSWNSGFPLYVDRTLNGKPVLDKKGDPKQDLKWDFTQANKFRFGHYTAKLLLVYNNGKSDVPLEAELGFWVLPWKILIVLAILLLLIGYAVYSFVRNLYFRARSGVRKKRRD